MKKLILSLVAIATISLSSFGQAPEAFKYQAVVRDAGNLILNNQAVGMQMTIQQGVTTVYQETFTTTTNAYGLVNLEIGNGTVVSGNFTTIDWANGTYFIETAVDVTGGTSYAVMGTSQLMSVPYALHANTADSIVGGVNIAETDPIFGASIANGITALDTANWNNHTIDTDTQLDSTGVAALGFVAGPHVDSTAIVNMGFVEEKTYAIGLWPELGGYVFWVSTDGKHGLVAETTDQDIASWYEAQNSISNPFNHSPNGQKFRDWRMPTKYELNEMYSQQGAIGGFANNAYWSSTESDFGNAWVQLFGGGLQGSDSKVGNLYVRSVRAF